MTQLLLRSGLSLLLFLGAVNPPVQAAEEPLRLISTVIIASNEGSDFNLDNDIYRDKLLQLFSYSAYEQVDQFETLPTKGKRHVESLPEGYELVLTLQKNESERVTFQAVIRKERVIFLDTVLSMTKPGVVFVGGPSIGEGDLILVIEAGY
jgi:hypothetical protein